MSFILRVMNFDHSDIYVFLSFIYQMCLLNLIYIYALGALISSYLTSIWLTLCLTLLFKSLSCVQHLVTSGTCIILFHPQTLAGRIWVLFYRDKNTGLDEAGIKIAGRNINNLRYADNITLMAESKEELKSLFFF